MTMRTVLIRHLMRQRYRNQEACAIEWGVTRQYVNMIMIGRRPLPWWAHGDLGL